jgi:DNA gyrase subunit A
MIAAAENDTSLVRSEECPRGKPATDDNSVLVALLTDGELRLLSALKLSLIGNYAWRSRLISIQPARRTDRVLCQLSSGRVAAVSVNQLSEASVFGHVNAARNPLRADPGERVIAVAPLRDFSIDRCLLVFTQQGRVKKTQLSEYLRVEAVASADMRLLRGDRIVSAVLGGNGGDCYVTTSDGKTLRFSHGELRATGRGSQGVQAIEISATGRVVAADWVGNSDGCTLLAATASGFVKRSLLTDYPRKGRATGGVLTIGLGSRDEIVTAVAVGPDDDNALAILEGGRTLPMSVHNVPILARDGRGVRVGSGRPVESSRLARIVVLRK